MMPKRSKNRRSGKTGRRSGKTGNAKVDSELMRMNKGAALSDVERTDLSVRPRRWEFTEVPPVRFMSQIVWVKLQRSTTINSAAAAISETNLAFVATDFANTTPGAGYLALFDQYSIYSVTATFTNPESPGNVTSILPTITTAIDLDGIANLGSLAALQSYATATTVTLMPGASVVRYIRPCTLTTLTSGPSTAVGRMWVDNLTAPQFNGLRTILQATPTAGLSIQVVLTYVFAFRNSI
jgi:hypothetical protein